MHPCAFAKYLANYQGCFILFYRRAFGTYCCILPLFTIENNKTERIVRRVFILVLDPIIITISVSVAHLHFRFQPVVKQRRFLTVWIYGDF
jgi:hypothetical protein